jgi:hypothetical protein
MMEGISLAPVLGGETWKNMTPLPHPVAATETSQNSQLKAGLALTALNKDYFGSNASSKAFENVFG